MDRQPPSEVTGWHDATSQGIGPCTKAGELCSPLMGSTRRSRSVFGNQRSVNSRALWFFEARMTAICSAPGSAFVMNAAPHHLF
jgi:hypothetical protein